MDARDAPLPCFSIDWGWNLPFKCFFDENIGMWASNCLFPSAPRVRPRDLERVRRCFRSCEFYELLSVSSWKRDEENKSLLYVFRFLYRLIKANNLYTTLVLSSQMLSDSSLLGNFAKPTSAFLTFFFFFYQFVLTQVKALALDSFSSSSVGLGFQGE